MTLLFLFSLIRYENEIPSFFYVNFVSSDERYVYVSSVKGVGIFDKYDFRFIKGKIFKEEPSFSFPDPYTNELYVYFKNGRLISFYREGSDFIKDKGFFYNVTAIGITPGELKIKRKSGIEILDKFSMVKTNDRGSPTIWYGENNIVEKNSPEIAFLSPFYRINFEGRKIHYNLICKDDRFFYVCTDGEGVWIYSKEFWREEGNIKMGACVDEIRVILNYRNTLLFAGVGYGEREGIVIRRGKEWKRYTELTFGIEEKHFYSGDTDNKIIVLGGRGKVLRIEKENFKTVFFDKWEELKTNDVLVKFPFVYIATDKGLFIFDYNLNIKEKFMTNVPVYSLEEINGIILLGTLNGFFELNMENKELNKVIDKKHFLNSKIKDILKNGEYFYVISDMGFIKLKKDISWSFEYPVPPPFSSGAITSNSLYGTESYIFIGLKKGGFYYFSPKRNMWYRVNYPGSITEKSVYGFEILRDTLYVGTDGGIYIYFVQK